MSYEYYLYDAFHYAFLSCHIRTTIMPHTRHNHVIYALRVNLHSVITWMSRNSLLETGAISENEITATGLERSTTWFVNEYSTVYLIFFYIDLCCSIQLYRSCDCLFIIKKMLFLEDGYSYSTKNKEHSESESESFTFYTLIQ